MEDGKGLRSFTSVTGNAPAILQSPLVRADFFRRALSEPAETRVECCARTLSPSRIRAQVRSRLQQIELDSRFGQYARIPRRICACMDQMGLRYERGAAESRLLTYYLFLGIVDELLDTGQSSIGEEVLERLKSPEPDVDGLTRGSDMAFMTEALKWSIPMASYRFIERRLKRLYTSVVAEQSAMTFSDFARQRERVGRLSADVSYWLVQPLLAKPSPDLRRFLQQVGAVGCLIDSVIDLTSDMRRGLLSFRPTIGDRLRLVGRTAGRGIPLLFAHPMMSATFVDAIVDTLRDRQRPRERPSSKTAFDDSFMLRCKP